MGLLYKTTQEVVKELCQQGRLYRFRAATPLLGRAARGGRQLALSPEVHDELLCSDDDEIAAATEALFERFILERQVTLRRKHRRKDRSWADLAVLDDKGGSLPDEIWELRLKVSKGHIRILGRFIEKNFFVALTWDWRDDMEDRWPDQMRACESEWRANFGERPPLKGGFPDAYISKYKYAL